MTSLSMLICNYRAGMADYNANAPEDDPAQDDYAEMSYRPPLKALREFTGPATNHAEALLALEQAETEMSGGDVDTAEVLIRAARLYLREVTP